MYVREYLEFIGNIHKIANLHSRVDEMIEITGLTAERKKKIGTLSKGYRQRVGLAQALIHDPKVLILDEPTSGLDPNQLVEIRKLIKEVGKQKTVMLSTHIMQEVEAICDRVIIINNGKIVADDATANLHKIKEGEEILLVEFDKYVEENLLRTIRNIISLENTDQNTWKIVSSSNTDIRPLIFNLAIENKLTVLSLTRQEHSIEEVFRKLTKN
jgi:ABC-2 type transport system ATP-binding protein